MAAGKEVNNNLRFQLTHESQKYDIVLEPNSIPLTLEDLSKKAEITTGVPLHKQRLIFKGKSLCEPTATLAALGIRNGSKIMLIGKKFCEEDEGHLKVMKEVENDVNATKIKLGEIEVEVTGIQKGFLESELQQEALGKLSRRVLACIEAFQKHLERLDTLSLTKATAEIQNRRKTIVRQIQEFLQDADNLQENITTLKVMQ